MMERQNIQLGNAFEQIVGFSRAVRVGPFVSVGGTAPIGEDGTTVGIGDATAQATRCFEIIRQALEAAGAGLSDVVRTRMMLVDVADFDAVVAVRKRFVGDFLPVDTIFLVNGFVNDEWLIEVEAEAIVRDT